MNQKAESIFRSDQVRSIPDLSLHTASCIVASNRGWDCYEFAEESNLILSMPEEIEAELIARLSSEIIWEDAEEIEELRNNQHCRALKKTSLNASITTPR